jgi:hypothetical protein
MRVESLVRKAMVAGALLAWAASAQAASFNISTSQAGWLASVQAMGPTTFGTGTFVGVGCAPGVACSGVAVNGLPGVSFATGGPSSSVSYDGGLLNNLVAGDYLEWTFTTPQNGWGGTFQMALNNGLAFQANDLSLGWIDVTSVGRDQELNGFLGFSSTDRFLGVRVFALQTNPPSPTAASSYKMTDVSIARAEQAAAPEPTSLALFGLAGAALTVARRRRRS